MPGRNSKFKSITINEKTFDRMGLTSQKVTYELEKHLEEQDKLRKFASQITHVPKTVRVYAPFSMKKEREREKI